MLQFISLYADVSEWQTKQTQNLPGFPRAGSSPAIRIIRKAQDISCAFLLCTMSQIPSAFCLQKRLMVFDECIITEK